MRLQELSISALISLHSQNLNADAATIEPTEKAGDHLKKRLTQ